MATLISKVNVEPASVTVGQSVFVQVCNLSGQPLSDPSVTVTIMGVPASERYLQWATPGTRKLIVRAVRGTVSETAEVSIPVGPSTAAAAAQILEVKQVAGQPYFATFTLGVPRRLEKTLTKEVAQASAAAAKAAATDLNPSAHVAVPVKAPATTYKWDFGDGKTLTTESPTATHDYFPAIEADKVAHSFHVTCTVPQDNLTVKTTLVLHSAYGLCKQTGTIVPPVTGDVYATFQHVGFSASMVVYNLEASAITLNRMACVPLSKNSGVALPYPQFIDMKVPVVLAAKSAVGIGAYIAQSQLQQGGIPGADVTGFTVYYSGETNSSGGKAVPVRFSQAFCISLADARHGGFSSSATAPANWDFGSALEAVTAAATHPQVGVSKQGGQVLDSATKTVAITLSANPRDVNTLAHVRSAIQAGLASIAHKAGGGTGDNTPQAGHAIEMRLAFDPSNPPPVAEGQECYPDDISDADAAKAGAANLVCQSTGKTVTELIPASFQNAQQGDVILSPAPVDGGDMIAAMFAALNPPQHHGHSGIMTDNFFEITHCTASPDQITANMNKDVAGIPTSLKGDSLQYGWPGSLTQSVQDATTSINLNDPSGTPYSFNSFNPGSIGENSEIIPPLVIKPLPENEATVRPTLRKVADTARSKGARYDANGKLTQKGGCYYCFYSYTKPDIALGFTDPAGADAGWAQGMSPAVCSGFVWLCMKESNIPLVISSEFETLSDFSQAAITGGAQVGSATRDGLVFYPQAERLQGAEALRQMLMNQALDQEYGLGTIPGINDTIAGPIADQLLNMFAFGNPNMVGSSAWQTPGDGNAVSPDNIVWWNPPYFGYAEPLQFLPQHTERYTTSEWKKIVAKGTIRGSVKLNGAPVPNAHVWVFLPGGDTFSKPDGSYTLSDIPTGDYTLQAQATVTTKAQAGPDMVGEYTSSQNITLVANPPLIKDIELQGTPVGYRRADITYSISCDHGDSSPFNAHGVKNAGKFSHQVFVNPGHTTDTGFTYSYNYNGGGYFSIDYAFTISLVDKDQIELKILAKMINSGDKDPIAQQSFGPVTIDAGKTLNNQFTIEHSQTGYHNGPAIFTFTVANNQQTG